MPKHFLTASVSEPDLRGTQRARIGRTGFGSLTLAVRKRHGSGSSTWIGQ
jgi:hypothetical protein